MNKDLAETIIFKHDFQKETMESVFKVVEAFLKRHKRILVGGMAIDMALRLKGTQLYPDDAFPDYDFYSPEFHCDAYDLGNELVSKSKGISVIQAFHVSTMKVRVNFQEAADITYIPKAIYDVIPTLKYKGFTIVHPHFQMIDQHRSLSLPYEKPPLETILGRWKKDIIRYDLLNKYYPVKCNNCKSGIAKNIIVKHSILQDNCLSGFTSLVYWVNEAKSLGFDTKGLHIWLLTWKEDKKEISMDLPESANFTILTDKLTETLKNFKGTPVHYNAVIDKVPARSIIDRYEILNNLGDLRTAYDTGSGYMVSNLQEVMCYLLTMGLFYKQDLAYYCYHVAQELLFFAAKSYKDTKNKDFLKFLPTHTTYGSSNEYDAYKVSMERVDVQFRHINRTLFTPRNAYPEVGKPVNPDYYNFDLKNNTLYQFDGLPRND